MLNARNINIWIPGILILWREIAISIDIKARNGYFNNYLIKLNLSTAHLSLACIVNFNSLTISFIIYIWSILTTAKIWLGRQRSGVVGLYISNPCQNMAGTAEVWSCWLSTPYWNLFQNKGLNRHCSLKSRIPQ